jgi:hypothetical protein
MNNDDWMFDLTVKMACGLFIFILFIKPLIDGIYQY